MSCGYSGLRFSCHGIVRGLQIGTFYEAVGYDAALLMEYGGYKWVRRHRVDPTIPCVGCHADALQWMLKQLVNEAGLTVVRCNNCHHDMMLTSHVALQQTPCKVLPLLAVVPDITVQLKALFAASKHQLNALFVLVKLAYKSCIIQRPSRCEAQLVLINHTAEQAGQGPCIGTHCRQSGRRSTTPQTTAAAWLQAT